jgi:hypothetical protein
LILIVASPVFVYNVPNPLGLGALTTVSVREVNSIVTNASVNVTVPMLPSATVLSRYTTGAAFPLHVKPRMETPTRTQTHRSKILISSSLSCG